MVSSCQFHTWDHRPLCIYNIMVFSHQFQTIEHSVYTTSWSLLTNSIHETIDHSLYIQHHGVFTPIPDHRPLCLYNIMVSSHQFHTWDQGPLSFYTTPWSLHTNSMHENRDHSQSMQHHGLFSPIPYISSYLCICNTMVSSHQFHTWDHRPLYIHHGLFSPVSYMRPGTTLSVYTTTWSLHANSIHETIDHSLYIQHHGLFTPIPDNIPLCLYNIMVSSHQFHTWDQGPLSFYTTSWSLHTNSIHETRDHSQSMQHHGFFTPIPYISSYLCICNIMVSSHQFHTWDHRPLSHSLSIQHHGLFSLIPYMRQGTILSFFTTPWSLLTKSIHETRAYSICLQHHGLFMPGPYMRP